MSSHENASTAIPLAERALGEIAVALPGAPALFRAAKLDYCCGGRASLKAAAAETSLLKLIFGELTMHMQKEELILFPAMRQGGRRPLQYPIAAMMADHDDHVVHLSELRRLTDDVRAPEAACTTWRALYAGLNKFADDLVEHIHTENNILFPRFLVEPD